MGEHQLYHKLFTVCLLILLASKAEGFNNTSAEQKEEKQREFLHLHQLSYSKSFVTEDQQQKRSIAQNKITKTINIGFILSPESKDKLFSTTVSQQREELKLESLIRNQLNKINDQLSQQQQNGLLRSSQIKLVTATIVKNPIEMSKIVCDQLIGNQMGGVSVVIVDTGHQYIASIASISFTLGLYNIPVIGTTLRDSSLFNKNIHSSYISLIPPYSHQADVWLNLMAELEFKRAFVLTSAENRHLLARLVDLIDQQEGIDNKNVELFKIEAIIEYDSAAFTSHNFAWQYLVKKISDLLENNICRVFLVHAQSKNDVKFFIDIINHLNMTNEGFALILSEDTIQVAKENQIVLPSGVISSQLSLIGQTMPELIAYAMDALDIVVRSISEIEYHDDAFLDVPNSCQLSPSIDWSTGIELYLTILRQTFSGYTGYISFDENGDRLTANYNLLNILDYDNNATIMNNGTQQQQQQIENIIGTFSKSPNLVVSEKRGERVLQDRSMIIKTKTVVNISSIQWPGGIRGKLISGVFVNKHLRIITLQEKPFVWVLKNQDCWQANNNNKNNKRLKNDDESQQLSIPCQRINSIMGNYEKFCCKGYCMDLLDEISQRLNFTYDLYLVSDNQYGNLESISSTDGVTLPLTSASDSSIINKSSSFLEKLTFIVGDKNVPDDELDSSTRAAAAVEATEEVTPSYVSYQQQKQKKKGLQQPVVNEINNTGVHVSRLKWTGLVGELVAGRADMAFAPLTITPQRALAIDFSKTFKFHGFSILLRRASKHTTLASFLQPFHNQLWILVIGVATHVVALSLYLLDRYSTFGRFGMKHHFIAKTARNIHDEPPLQLSSSIWFSWSILLNSGVGEHTPKSLSGRVLGIFWSGFAMIVVASYTANLAAFLVLDSREETPTLSGIDDPRLRSGDLAFNFATVKGSAVDAYLQSQIEYINLYRKMEEFNFNNVDESILALRAGIIDALIWDSTRLEWEVATDEKCSLGIAGELFGSSGYGIGLQKDSYWTENVTTRLLELHESGFMIDLDKKWVAAGKQQQGSLGPNCERRNEDNPETLGIFNIAGVFILFACGLFTSFGLIVVERFCYKYRNVLLAFGSRSRQLIEPNNQKRPIIG